MATKKIKTWQIDAMTKAVLAGTTQIDSIVDERLRRKVEQAVAAARRPVDPRKSIAQDLDVAAQRATIVGRTPASSKQCWYLAGLLHDRGLTANDVECGLLNTQAVLCGGRASRLIGELLEGSR